MMPSLKIPADFPGEAPLASITGAQPKLAARIVNGQYVVGLTEEERLERYEACEDLAQQFSVYCARKVSENGSLTHALALERARKGFARKVGQGEWDFSESEQDWVMKRAQRILGW